MNKICLFLLSLLPVLNPPVQNDGKPVVFSHTEYDFGKVEAKNGVLYHSFPFANTGRDTLSLAMPSASCDCLDAQVSPARLAPGERGEVKVKLNPAGMSGVIMRSVGLQTVDRQELATLVLTADVIPAFPQVEALCPVVLSKDIRSSVKDVRFGYLYWGETALKKYFLLANTSSAEKKLSITSANPALSIEAPESIAPGATVEVVLQYQFENQEYRSVEDQLEISVDGEPTERSITANCIRLRRLPEAAAQPSLQTYPSQGKLKSKLFSKLYEGSIELRNSGRGTLHILAVRGTANTNLISPMTLAPGETFTVRLQTARSSATLELFTDDPLRPYKELIFSR